MIREDMPSCIFCCVPAHCLLCSKIIMNGLNQRWGKLFMHHIFLKQMKKNAHLEGGDSNTLFLTMYVCSH